MRFFKTDTYFYASSFFFRVPVKWRRQDNWSQSRVLVWGRWFGWRRLLTLLRDAVFLRWTESKIRSIKPRCCSVFGYFMPNVNNLPAINHPSCSVLALFFGIHVFAFPSSLLDIYDVADWVPMFVLSCFCLLFRNDLLKPKVPGVFTLADFKKNRKASGIFFDFLLRYEECYSNILA